MEFVIYAFIVIVVAFALYKIIALNRKPAPKVAEEVVLPLVTRYPPMPKVLATTGAKPLPTGFRTRGGSVDSRKTEPRYVSTPPVDNGSDLMATMLILSAMSDDTPSTKTSNDDSNKIEPGGGSFGGGGASSSWSDDSSSSSRDTSSSYSSSDYSCSSSSSDSSSYSSSDSSSSSSYGSD